MLFSNSPRLDQNGQGLTEYIILLLLVAVVSIVTTKSLGGTIRTKIQEARNHINSDLTLTSDHGGGGLFGGGGLHP